MEDDDATGYAVYRAWETNLRIELRMTIEEYSVIPVAERALMVCSRKISEWFSSLQMEKDRRERALHRR